MQRQQYFLTVMKTEIVAYGKDPVIRKMFLGDGILWLIGKFRGVFETDMNWSMVRGNRRVIYIPNYGVYG